MLPHLCTTGHGTVSAPQGVTARDVSQHMLYARGDPPSCSISSHTATARDHPALLQSLLGAWASVPAFTIKWTVPRGDPTASG